MVRRPPQSPPFPSTTLFLSDSDLPQGAGLSSSAPIECATAVALASRASSGRHALTPYSVARATAVAHSIAAIGRAHVCTPVTSAYRLPSSARKVKRADRDRD